MLPITVSVRIYLAKDPVDMRKSFNGLTALTESVLEHDPTSGHCFVFVNRRRDRLKLLYWDGTGFCIWYKQLEAGCFEIPAGRDASSVELTSTQLSLILDGIDLASAKQRKRFRRSPSATSSSSPPRQSG